jgi:GH18 family chitinase
LFTLVFVSIVPLASPFLSDFFGAWSPTTGINAPLYYQGWGDEDFNVNACVANWIAGGGTRDKINIGLPFYGRSFLNAKGLNETHAGADKNVWGIDDGTPQYFNIMSKLPSMIQVWDEKTWTQFAYFEGGGLVSFDNENAICAKTEFVQQHNLNGFIIWELTGVSRCPLMLFPTPYSCHFGSCSLTFHSLYLTYPHFRMSWRIYQHLFSISSMRSF